MRYAAWSHSENLTASLSRLDEEEDRSLSNPCAINLGAVIVNRADLYRDNSAPENNSDGISDEDDLNLESRELLLVQLGNILDASLDVGPSSGISIGASTILPDLSTDDTRSKSMKKKKKTGKTNDSHDSSSSNIFTAGQYTAWMHLGHINLIADSP